MLMSRKLRSKIPYKIEDLKPKVICDDAHKLIIKDKINLINYQIITIRQV